LGVVEGVGQHKEIKKRSNVNELGRTIREREGGLLEARGGDQLEAGLD